LLTLEETRVISLSESLVNEPVDSEFPLMNIAHSLLQIMDQRTEAEEFNEKTREKRNGESHEVRGIEEELISGRTNKTEEDEKDS
jgi:hypothetical protein